MYRGRPPPRGVYPPRPPRPYPVPDYDRSRPRPPYHHSFHEHGLPDPHRRSPPRRTYPSPGSGSHRGGEYRSGGPPREGSPSPHESVPINHNLVITVGNELTAAPGPVPLRHHDRDFPTQPEYKRSRDRSLDRSRAKSRGRSKSRPRSRSRSPDWSRAKGQTHSRSRSPDWSRAKGQTHSWSRSPDRSRAKSRGRIKSRPRSRSRSPDRSRAKSRGRSKSRPRSLSRSPDWSRAKGQPHSWSRSPDRSRAKSRGRSKSRPCSRSRSPDWYRAKSWRGSHSQSPDRSRAKSRGRSKSRCRSQSRSPDSRQAKTWAQSKSRARSHSSPVSRSKSRSRSRGRSRQRSRSLSSSSSSSSRSCSDDKNYKKEFTELEMARRRKELEEMLTLPTKSILKKRTDSEDSPSIRSIDSPRCLDGSNVSQVVEQLLQAVHGMEPQMVATMLSELQSDPQLAHRAGIDAEIKEILNLLGGPGAGAQRKTVDDIDDEEKFLYGDSEDPKPPPVSEPVRHHGLDLYGDVTEETLYGDYPPAKSTTAQSYSLPPGGLPRSQVPPTTPELNSTYASQLPISSDQSVSIQRSNLAPPTTQAMEEYEKIQDLFKTIGLDLGVVEIGKMAARTKERLHGLKPSTKTPTRRRRYSSGSSDSSRSIRRRSRSSSSSSSSSSHSQGGKRGGKRGGSWSSQDSRRTSAPPDSHRDRKAQQTTAALQHKEPSAKTSDPMSNPPGLLVPTYPPPQVHATMTPNYPPPGYGQYGNYLPFMHQPPMYPPMYPPPNMSMPPPSSHEEFPAVCPYNEPYHMMAPDSGPKGLVRSAPVGEKGSFALDSHDRKASEEQNNQSQKQKVLEEREKLKQEREIRMKKKEYLMKELERLRKQQGELLRRKRRERDGHKDPLLQEISHLQEEVMSQISNLRKEHEEAEKKRSEIEKVALILGLSPADRPQRVSIPAEGQEGGPPPPPPPPPPPETKKQEPERSPEGQQRHLSSTFKTVEAPALRASSNKQPLAAPPAPPPPEPFEYYDAGNHWCKNCNVTSGSMFDFYTHLHSKTHRKTMDPYDRPWASTPTKILKNTPLVEKLTKPAKGSEFLVPVRGFFCLLCKEFYGDAICAEEHVTTHAHNDKYKRQMYENPLYEQRRNLDRQAGLALETSGKKRKHEDNEKGSKEKEGRIKHKKEKKDKEKKEEDDTDAHNEEKSKGKKEEVENKLIFPKTEELKRTKSLEEERSSFTKKDDDKNYICTKRDDRYRYSEDERGNLYKYSKEKDSRHQYRRNSDDRYDDQPKSGPRDEDKYTSSKYFDSRPKYDRKQDEEKPKAEKEAFKKPELGKPTGKADLSKPELPPKLHEPPKIFCGPSPAMRAKLRKQSLEASKPALASTATTFGKFIWKKKENPLSAVAEKMAAEFIKEDEAAVSQQPVSAEDSFAKSRAFAKEIAEKLENHQLPSPFVSNGANRGRIRPNLPAPAAVLRKTTLMGKPASLNNFLSIRPQNTSLQGPSPKDINNTVPNVLNSQSTPLEAKSVPPVDKPAPLVDRIKPVSTEPTSEAKQAQSTVIKIVSDVAAPGVPESEQTRTVFVKPPPFMNMSERGQRSEKLPSNLAAAKALEVFGIFYSTTEHVSPPSITKPDSSVDKSNANKSPLLVAQAPHLQARPLTHVQTQSPAGLHKPPNLHSNSSSQSPQSQLTPEVPSASVWSLKCSVEPTPEVTSSVTQTTQTKPTLSSDSDAHTEDQDQSSTSKSQFTPQIEPAEPEPVPQFAPRELDQETQSWSHLDTHPDTTPEQEPKQSPKNRGKKAPSALVPVRQTRYQTRRQQQQSQSETEPELALGNTTSAPSHQTGQDTPDPGSRSEERAPSNEITPKPSSSPQT